MKLILFCRRTPSSQFLYVPVEEFNSENLPMSKKILSSYLSFVTLALILQIFTRVEAQDVDVRVTIGFAGETASIRGAFDQSLGTVDRRHLYFRRSEDGYVNTGTRVSDLALYDENGRKVDSKRLIPGEYLANSDFSEWTYQIDLSPSKIKAAAAHSSWLNTTSGVLMLDDLLPQINSSAKSFSTVLKLDLPVGWSAYSIGETSHSGNFAIPDLRDSVIILGRDLRTATFQIESARFRLVFSGRWLFTDDEARDIVKEIFSAYRDLFGTLPDKEFQIAFLKFPSEVVPGQWEAETRGSNIIIISSDMPFRTQSLQRIHEQLRHEIFHFWIPNSVELTGDYAWFYEGAALYESLKMAVFLNRIRFEDFLDTLSRAYTLDEGERPRRPLITPGLSYRSSGYSLTRNYARGILVAFLSDVALIRASKGKRNLESVLRTLYAEHRRNLVPIDGNTAVISALGLGDITERFVLGSDKIDWENTLGEIGLVQQAKGREIVLSVSPKLTGGQKAILNKLGYNSWRKIIKKK